MLLVSTVLDENFPHKIKFFISSPTLIQKVGTEWGQISLPTKKGFMEFSINP
jgi:hypothetical protein